MSSAVLWEVPKSNYLRSPPLLESWKRNFPLLTWSWFSIALAYSNLGFCLVLVHTLMNVHGQWKRSTDKQLKSFWKFMLLKHSGKFIGANFKDWSQYVQRQTCTNRKLKRLVHIDFRLHWTAKFSVDKISAPSFEGWSYNSLQCSSRGVVPKNRVFCLIWFWINQWNWGIIINNSKWKVIRWYYPFIEQQDNKNT